MKMKDIRRADPDARRRSMQIAAVAFLVVFVTMIAFKKYYPALSDWILSEQAEAGKRVGYMLIVLALIVSVPLAGLAAYLRSFGSRVIRAEEIPPPGQKVTRDTVIIRGRHAVIRGRLIQGIALVCLIAILTIWFLLFWFWPALTC
ncbi:MAG: hypothetical protein M0P57_08695 [Syntrophales bacterium]|jgi:hypothetical protein|nr:hypothetical protein [Syntrophales bacterium]MDY0044144.1 hypothetical protein [Syntrophales bacterium]